MPPIEQNTMAADRATEHWLLSGGNFPAGPDTGAQAPVLRPDEIENMHLLPIHRLFFRECKVRGGRYEKEPFRAGPAGTDDEGIGPGNAFPRQCKQYNRINEFYNSRFLKTDHFIAEIFAETNGDGDATRWFRAGVLHLILNNNVTCDLMLICLDRIDKVDGQSLYRRTMDFALSFIAGEAPVQTHEGTVLYKYARNGQPYTSLSNKSKWEGTSIFTIMAVNTKAASVYANTGFTFFPTGETHLLNPENKKVYLQVGKPLNRHASSASKAAFAAKVQAYVNFDNRPAEIPTDCWNLMQVLNEYTRVNKEAILRVYANIPNSNVETDVAYIEGIAGVPDADKKTYATLLVYLCLFMFACQPDAVANDSEFDGAGPKEKAIAIATRAAQLLSNNGSVMSEAALNATSYQDLLQFSKKILRGNLEFTLVRTLP